MKARHKQDILGLLGLLFIAALLAKFIAPVWGVVFFVSTGTTITVMEALQRRRQRQLIPKIEEAATSSEKLMMEMRAICKDPALLQSIDQNLQATARLKETVAAAKDRLS